MDARDEGPAAERPGAVAALSSGDPTLIVAAPSRRIVLSRTAIAAIAAAFLLMGCAVAAYGPLLEHLSRRYGVSLPVAGATISVYFAGSLPGVLVAMYLFERFPARWIVTAAIATSSVGLAAVALAFTWPLFLLAVCVVGFGFGVLVLGLNQLVAYSEGGRRTALLNALNGAYSAGAVAGPLLVAAFAADHFSALYVFAAVVWLALIPASSGISGRLPVAADLPRRPGALVAMFILAFVLYVGLENGTGGWMTSHLESTGIQSSKAATITSGFWLALVTGRLLMTLVPARVHESTMVLIGSGLATVALLAASISAVAPLAYIAAGLALAPIFPTGIVWLARLRPGDARATAWLYPAASIGGVVGPGVIGLVIAAFGVQFAPLVLAIVAIAMSISFWVANSPAIRAAKQA
jgi:MFS transporter, FHS family, glucose/mannose:H+ symporter